jgi:tetratricopeptide (TPR) repeat protein
MSGLSLTTPIEDPAMRGRTWHRSSPFSKGGGRGILVGKGVIMKQLMRLGGGLGLILACLAGCIQLDMLVKLKPDGSGTVEETVLIAKDSMPGIQDMMKGIVEGMADQMQMKGMEAGKVGAGVRTFDNGLDLFDEAKLREDARDMGEGVTYVSGERVERGEAQGYRALYAFSDVNQLRLSISPSARTPSNFGDTSNGPEAEQAFATFRFVKGPPSVLRIMVPEEMTSDILQPPQMPGSTAGRAAPMAVPEQMKQMFKDMRMKMVVEVQGKILRTNATHREGSRITLMDVDFGKLLGQMETLQQINEEMSRNPEKAKARLKNLSGIKVELNPEVRVEFAAGAPMNADYWIDKGAIAYTYGNLEAAIAYFNKAVELEPDNASAHFNLGISRGATGQYDKAVSSINKAIEMNPEKGSYFYGRGNVYLMSGNQDKAMEDFKRAAALGDPDAKTFLKRALSGQ